MHQHADAGGVDELQALAVDQEVVGRDPDGPMIAVY
jgi:hypothetical protein